MKCLRTCLWTKYFNLKLQSTIMRVRTLFTDTDPSCSYSQFCHLLHQHFYVILEFGILEYCHDAININLSHFFRTLTPCLELFPTFFFRVWTGAGLVDFKLFLLLLLFFIVTWSQLKFDIWFQWVCFETRTIIFNPLTTNVPII